jgi:hypothetical protein
MKHNIRRDFFHELEKLRAQNGELGEMRIGIDVLDESAGEIIHYIHLDVSADERIGNMGSDKSGPSGH